jgi:hypothetical protein
MLVNNDYMNWNICELNPLLFMKQKSRIKGLVKNSSC